ncbi:hypothetical protein [Alienimonas sp. DA493]|uniref:hypothetical protein n=1 Tax=Alienimonas sp. DA493 TaxID=3373605 RepID=UPI003754FDE7
MSILTAFARSARTLTLASLLCSPALVAPLALTGCGGDVEQPTLDESPEAIAEREAQNEENENMMSGGATND